MRTNLLKVLWKKELIHWSRIMAMGNKYKSWLPKILAIIFIGFFISIFHYIFALMHLFYECMLYIFARKNYRENLKRLSLTV